MLNCMRWVDEVCGRRLKAHLCLYNCIVWSAQRCACFKSPPLSESSSLVARHRLRHRYSLLNTSSTRSQPTDQCITPPTCGPCMQCLSIMLPSGGKFCELTSIATHPFQLTTVNTEAYSPFREQTPTKSYIVGRWSPRRLCTPRARDLDVFKARCLENATTNVWPRDSAMRRYELEKI